MGKVDVIDNFSQLENYEVFIINSKVGMFYHSRKYLEFLNSFINAEPLFLIYREKQKILGILPSFVKYSKLGNVLNSLPFFGSHGGVVAKENDGLIKRLMLAYLREEVLPSYEIDASTIITTPFESHLKIYREVLNPDYMDFRIGQIVRLLTEPDEEKLMMSFESRCRRAIRKAIKNKVSVEVLEEYDDNIIERIYEIHVENMTSINGLPKPKEFFYNIEKFFDIHEDYDIYIAKYQDDMIGALLVFYYKNFVEYYIPAVDVNFRSLNPTNLIVFMAMLNAIKRGFKYWNFGGTWQTQGGVYRFKRSFGARDFKYRYFINITSDIPEFMKLRPDEISEIYKWFYVAPFNVLEGRGRADARR